MDIPVLVKINNTCIITTPDIKEVIVKVLDNPKPQPCRLTMFRCVDNCQFCPNPKGDVFCHYVCVEDHHGFLSCTECCELAEEAVEEWNTNEAYGRANKFRNKTIKVKRSSGIIEEDWKLNEKYTMAVHTSKGEVVHCVNNDKNISKWIKIDDLLEWNKEQTEQTEQAEQVEHTEQTEQIVSIEKQIEQLVL